MSPTPDRTLDDLQQTIADLKRQLAESNAERDEAQAQQAATAEVLEVINSSPGDLGPVFDAILDKAMGLCEAAHGHVWIYDGERAHPVAVHGEPQLVEWMRRVGSVGPFSGSSGRPSPLGRVVRGEPIAHVADALEEEAYRSVPVFRELVDVGGIRTTLNIALRKGDAPLGIIALYRQEVRPFSEKQIALLQNFAAQAVIAIENARLITETREALDQQTATAEVLQVINSSPGDLAPVFEAMLEKAMALCGFAHGSLQTYDGRQFRAVAVRGLPEPLAALLRQGFRPDPKNPMQRLLEGDRFVQIPDLTRMDAPEVQIQGRTAVEAGSRTLLCIPLRKDDALLGQIVAVRREVRPFSEKEIALLENFAAQAVIAMENARLLTETREALEQQTATTEVLQVINSSPGDLAPVFDAILEKAHSLCGVAFGFLQLYDSGKLRAVALRGVPDSVAAVLRQPIEPTPGLPPARLLDGERIVQEADMAALVADGRGGPRAGAIIENGVRTALFVPLRKDANFLGCIAAFRKEVQPFSNNEIALLENFAAQAVARWGRSYVRGSPR